MKAEKRKQRAKAKKQQQNLNKSKQRQQKLEQPKDLQQEIEQPKDTQQELEQPEDLQQKLKNEEQQKLDAEKLQQELQNKIKEIREFIGDDNYIFRGENNKNYKEISSKLRRYFQTIIGQAILQGSELTFNFDSIKQPLESQLEIQLEKQFGKGVPKLDFASIEKSLKENIFTQLAQRVNYPLSVESVQTELILKDVQEYVDFENEIDILAELQHHGGATNLIDFSYDLAVALFFACDGEPEEDGRLILLRADDEGVIAPKKNQNNRIVFQKSVFVKRDEGYIDEQEEGVEKIIISKELKPLLLNYVQKYFGIKTETIYGDLIGYIQNQERNNEIYKQFFGGLVYYRGGFFEKAAESYEKAIDLKPNFADAYNNRGIVYNKENDKERAMEYINKAIELNPKYPAAYFNRGIIYSENSKHKLAIADYSKAIELNPKYAEAYFNRGIVKADMRNYERAKEDFEIALKLIEQQGRKNDAAVVRKKIDEILAAAP